MLMSPFRLFVEPNQKAYVEGAANLSQKRITGVIDNLQELLFSEDHLATYIKGMIGVNVLVNTEVIDLECARQRASGRPARKRTKTAHFRADVSA